MKRLLIVAVAALFVLEFSSCKGGKEKVKVPEKVKTAFENNFSNTGDVEWEKEKPNIWEVNFEIDDVDMEALFDNNGTWLKTETEIAVSDVPEVVINSAKKKFSDYEIYGAERIETPEQVTFKVKIKNGSGKKMYVVFDKTGKGLKREKAEDD
jgi:hypothetical protein